MAGSTLQQILHHLSLLGISGRTNRELLERYVDFDDDAAFAALVDRHGKLVLSVCRRVLGACPDVDDVFQASFVVLSRKARSIRKRPSLASWLYGVAYHLATKVRYKRARQRRCEGAAEGSPDQLPERPTMHTDPVSRASRCFRPE